MEQALPFLPNRTDLAISLEAVGGEGGKDHENTTFGTCAGLHEEKARETGLYKQKMTVGEKRTFSLS